MNRTIEAWQRVAETRFHGRVLDQAIEDMQEIARQRDELLAVLESIIDLHDSASRGKQVAETIGKARAVIATVKGE